MANEPGRKPSLKNLVRVGDTERKRGWVIGERDKFIEVDNCIVPGTLQEHIRLLGRRDFGISLPPGRLPEDVVSCRRRPLAWKNPFGYWNNALLSLLQDFLLALLPHWAWCRQVLSREIVEGSKIWSWEFRNGIIHSIYSASMYVKILFVYRIFIEKCSYNFSFALQPSLSSSLSLQDTMYPH